MIKKSYLFKKMDLDNFLAQVRTFNYTYSN